MLYWLASVHWVCLIAINYGWILDFPGGSSGKASAYNARYPGSIPRLGRSTGEGNGNPIQYSCLENPMDGGAWLAIVMGSQRVGHDWAISLSRSWRKF